MPVTDTLRQDCNPGFLFVGHSLKRMGKPLKRCRRQGDLHFVAFCSYRGDRCLGRLGREACLQKSWTKFAADRSSGWLGMR